MHQTVPVYPETRSAADIPCMKRRLARLALLLAVLLAPAPALAAQLEVPVATPGAPLPADGPAASLLRPAMLRATFRVLPADSALYIGTPWMIRDLAVTLVGPGTQRRTITARTDLPGTMLGVRLPADAWRADRIELEAVTVSSVEPPYLLSADQLAQIAARDWWYAMAFGAFAVLAIAFGTLACAVRSRLAAWYAAGAGAQALLIVPWLGIVRPPPDASQPLHAVLTSFAYVASASVALAYLCDRTPRFARRALWTIVAACAALACGLDVMQDLWPVPDAGAQAATTLLGTALFALGVLALVRRLRGAAFFAAGTAVTALGIATAAFAPAVATFLTLPLSALPPLSAAIGAVFIAVAVAATLHEREAARARTDAGAHVDGLTGLPNRTAFDARLETAWCDAARRRTPLAVLLLDVDRLHAYNDCYGHLAGDDVLRRIASAAATAASRERGFAARYGGEELAVVLAACEGRRARDVAEALRADIVALDVAHGGVPSRRLTVSVGVASVGPDARDGAHDLMRRAADALYVAKTLGRNRVVGGEPPEERYAPKTESATASFTAYVP